MTQLASTAIVGTLLLFAIARMPEAEACDCDAPEPSALDAWARFSTVVHGRVVAARSKAGAHEVDLHVLRAWKGANAGDVVTIPIETSSCGYFLAPGDDVLIYVPDGTPVQQCAGTRTARVRFGIGIEQDAATLGEPRSVVTASPEVTLPADVIAEGVVTSIDPGHRTGFRMEVTGTSRGARRGEVLSVTTPIGACAIAKPTVGKRYAVRAARFRGTLVIASCAATTSLRPLAVPQRARR